MPKLIINPVSVASSQINFQVEFSHVKELQIKIATKEYGLKSGVTSLNQLHIKRLNLANPCPMKDGSNKLDLMKMFYAKYFLEACKHLAVLINNDLNCPESKQFAQYCQAYTNRLKATNTEQSWDELYNFNNLVKRTISDVKPVTYLSALSNRLNQELDQYFKYKDQQEELKLAKKIIARKSAAIIAFYDDITTKHKPVTDVESLAINMLKILNDREIASR